MKEFVIVCLVAFAAGSALACQVGVNAQLRREAGDPLLAAFLSFLVGTLLLAVILIVRRPDWPTLSQMGKWPGWVWLGGVLGAGYVVSAAALAVRVGAAAWLATVVAGQILTCLLLDQFGLIGFAPRPLTLSRLTGAILLIVGVILVLRR